MTACSGIETIQGYLWLTDCLWVSLSHTTIITGLYSNHVKAFVQLLQDFIQITWKPNGNLWLKTGSCSVTPQLLQDFIQITWKPLCNYYRTLFKSPESQIGTCGSKQEAVLLHQNLYCLHQHRVTLQCSPFPAKWKHRFLWQRSNRVYDVKLQPQRELQNGTFCIFFCRELRIFVFDGSEELKN